MGTKPVISAEKRAQIFCLRAMKLSEREYLGKSRLARLLLSRFDNNIEFSVLSQS